MLRGIYGHEQIYDSAWKEAAKELKSHVKSVNDALSKGNEWLVTGQKTLADVVIAVALTQAF